MFGGITAFFTGLKIVSKLKSMSFKQIMTMVVWALAIAAIGFMVWSYWSVKRERDAAQSQIKAIVVTVSTVAGKPIKEGQLVEAIKNIGTNLTNTTKSRDSLKTSIDTQSGKIRILEKQSADNKAQADRAVNAVKVVVKERDKWIEKAEAASTRTERLPDQTELKQVEETLDALYRNGF